MRPCACSRRRARTCGSWIPAAAGVRYFPRDWSHRRAGGRPPPSPPWRRTPPPAPRSWCWSRHAGRCSPTTCRRWSTTPARRASRAPARRLERAVLDRDLRRFAPSASGRRPRPLPLDARSGAGADPRDRAAHGARHRGRRNSGAGCCGMAGAFGYRHPEISSASRTTGFSLRSAPRRRWRWRPGTSCRHQIAECAGTRVLHPAEPPAAACRTDRPDRNGRLNSPPPGTYRAAGCTSVCAPNSAVGAWGVDRRGDRRVRGQVAQPLRGGEHVEGLAALRPFLARMWKRRRRPA